MKLVLLNTNGSYSHETVFRGIRKAFEQLKVDGDIDFIEVNIGEQDSGKIEEYNPDFCFVITPLAAGYRALKKYKGRRVIIYETEGLYESQNTVDNITYTDYFVTVDKKAVEYFRSQAPSRNQHCKFIHMPLGFDADVYKFQEVTDEYKSDVCFAGAIFNRRRKVIDALSKIKDSFKFRVIAPADWVGRIIRQDAIQHLHRDVVSAEELGKYYAGSKIVLCINRDYDPANNSGLESTTPGRVFQETACRRLVMIDNSRLEVFDYFEDGKEIVTFDAENSNDVREKILYYLEHEKEREAIAHNGYIRTMSENTWYYRIKKLLTQIKEAEL